MTEPQIRKAFVNCTQGEAKRLNVPKSLADQPWEHLDYLGWRDPQSPARGYLVAPRAGRSGQRGNSVGTYICADLACSLCIRGRRETGTATMHETLTLDQRIRRLLANLDAFVTRVRTQPA